MNLRTPILTLGLFTAVAILQSQDTIYDESKVPAYTLPDPLLTEAGKKVARAETWTTLRRPEVLELFETHVYGKAPSQAPILRFEVFEKSDDALNGLAKRKQVAIEITTPLGSRRIDVLLYTPNAAKRRVPAFLGLNFYGNHTVCHDPAIRLSTQWMRGNEDKGIVNNRATEASRGKSSSRWPIPMILERGYGIATVYCGDIDPDFDDGFQNGVHALFAKGERDKPAGDAWGTIAAWAWGLSRALDYLQIDPDIDGRRIAVMGHSRLGKTSLWAGAVDERFALVISNNSGCGGAALSRRRFGESVKRINTAFPHWFCDNFNQYNDNEGALPVDQHQLIALMAPRPVYVASAEQDRWADPHGEFLSAYHAGPVYRLLGYEPLRGNEMPQINQPVHARVGYHIRGGKHDVTDFDWEQYLRFADRHMK